MAVSKQVSDQVSEQVSEQGEDATTDDDVSSLSYEQARDELISIVAALEGGQLGLEESMRLWRRGEALAAHCSTWLDGAEAALTEGDET